MKHIIIDLHNRNLNDTDIDDEFLINNFDKNQHQEIFVDFSNNNLTEQSTIKILEHLSYLSKEVICIDFSHNHINFTSNNLISSMIRFIDTFGNSRINIVGNPHSEHISDFIYYELLDKIIY